MHLETSELIKRANHSMELKDFSQARMIYEEVINREQKNEEALFQLANLHHMKGDLGKAIRAFRKLLEVNPNHTDASIALSVLLNDIGQYEQAQGVYEEADKRVKSDETGVQDRHINTQFALKHFELAELYSSYGRSEEAIYEYNKSIGLNPDHLEVRVKLAKVYSKQGLFAKAKQVLTSLKNERPDFLNARMALGLLYYGKGQVIEARTEWHHVLQRDANHSEAKMYLRLSENANEVSLYN